MYTVICFSKLIFHFLLAAAAALLFAMSRSRYVFLFYIPLAIWLQLYLNGLKITPREDKLIKQGGSIFRRKTVYMIKNINAVTTYRLNHYLPAVLRLAYTNKDVYILGLTGSQVRQLEKIIEKV